MKLRRFLLAGAICLAPLQAQEAPPSLFEPPAVPVAAPAVTPPVAPPVAPPVVPVVPPVVAPEPEPRVTFEVKFPPEKGGGAAAGSAGALEYQREDLAVASGGVELRYQGYQIKAERVAVDLRRKLLTAEGNVILDQGPRRLTGDTLTFDLEAQTGTLTNATAAVEPDMYFVGEEIAKIGADTYSIRDGRFTSCTDAIPDWSFGLTRAQLEVEGYARVHNATLWVKKAPVFYFPYVLWPAKRERASGLLIPNVGYSQRRGSYLGLAYFQTLGRSYDTTLFLDLYSKKFVGLGNEFRYRPSELTKGRFEGFFIDDPESGDVRYKLRLDQETTDLPWGLRSVVAYQDFSDFEFFRQFERDEDDNSLRTLNSSAFVSGNWGPQSVNFSLKDRRTFIDGQAGASRVIRQQQLPEFEYRLRPTKLFRTPLYLQVLSSANYLTVDRGPAYEGSYGRADLFPELSLPVSTLPWLSVSLNAGERLTWYGDRLAEQRSVPAGGNQTRFFCGDGQVTTRDTLCGDSLTRILPTAGAKMVGPSFSRIFARASGTKWKHIIEPRWDYSFIGEFDDVERVPLFDEVDPFRAQDLGRVALVNRLLVKPADAEEAKADDAEDGEDGEEVADVADAADRGAREVLSFEIARAYSFDPERRLQFPRASGRAGDEGTALGPLTTLLRFSPGRQFNARLEAEYNTLFKSLESTSFSGNWQAGADHVGLTWFTRYDPESGATRGDQVRLDAAVQAIPSRLRVEALISYNVEMGELQQQRVVLDYASQCYGVRFEYRDFHTANRQERDYRLALTLKNVGTFLDLNHGGGRRN